MTTPKKKVHFSRSMRGKILRVKADKIPMDLREAMFELGLVNKMVVGSNSSKVEILGHVTSCSRYTASKYYHPMRYWEVRFSMTDREQLSVKLVLFTKVDGRFVSANTDHWGVVEGAYPEAVVHTILDHMVKHVINNFQK